MKSDRKAVRARGEDPGRLAFILYCLFITSYFLHLGDRIGILGTLRIDILLSGSTLLLTMFAARRAPGENATMDPTGKLLLAICVYVVVTLPFVRWPGSVLGHGWEPFLKAACFYYFTVSTVTTEKRLKWFLTVFLSIQVFRVLEPLYMHLTTGYWGSFTNMGNYELMDRLSGSPFDIINPNGLAFVILVCISLCHSLLGRGQRRQKLLYLVLLAPLLYAMALTGSRSGALVLFIFALMAVWKSKHRALAMSAVAVMLVVIFMSLSDLERQRYLSIVDHSAKGAATAEGRVDGIWIDFKVGMERPIFGHGLGTSLEANANAYGEPKPSHTLYTEVLQELGLIGLAMFLAFMLQALRNCRIAYRETRSDPTGLLNRTAAGMVDFAILLMIFSVASYGLNEYEWYLLAGLSVALRRVVSRSATSPNAASAPSRSGRAMTARALAGAGFGTPVRTG